MDIATRTGRMATVMGIRIIRTAPPFHSDSVTRTRTATTRPIITEPTRTATATTVMNGPLTTPTRMDQS
jgi:hypothetical protein